VRLTVNYALTLIFDRLQRIARRAGPGEVFWDGAALLCTSLTCRLVCAASNKAKYSSATLAWTGSEMIVWGGVGSSTDLNTGGRYNASIDSWTATSTTNNVPSARYSHTAVWTGSEMIVWGGFYFTALDSGGRYCAQSSVTPTPTPTATPTSTATATPTSIPRPTPTPRLAPSPRPRPTPAPRP
jgi:hypothetical protein